MNHASFEGGIKELAFRRKHFYAWSPCVLAMLRPDMCAS